MFKNFYAAYEPTEKFKKWLNKQPTHIPRHLRGDWDDYVATQMRTPLIVKFLRKKFGENN